MLLRIAFEPAALETLETLMDEELNSVREQVDHLAQSRAKPGEVISSQVDGTTVVAVISNDGGTLRVQTIQRRVH